MKIQNQIKDQIVHYSKELRLPSFRNEYEDIAQESAKEHAQ